jgi:type IV pilus biogenesis protein CpaD/CtpE
MKMENALKLIITKSPEAMNEALKTLQAIRANSPMVQRRYNRTVEIALSDPQAEFTMADRAVLAELLTADGEGARSFMLRVRLTEAEQVALQETADREGISISELVRRKSLS